MANQTARGKGGKKMTAKTKAASASKKMAKKIGKSAPKSLPARTARARTVYAVDHGLMTAFHHMQRASVVMSLMEKGSGEDLRDLLKRGVSLYRKAMETDAEHKIVVRAIGELLATEQLSIAGLYETRDKHKQKVASPTPEWLAKVIAETGRRLEQVKNTDRGKGEDLFPVTAELLRQAENKKLDAQLAFELAMAADSLCFALENGL